MSSLPQRILWRALPAGILTALVGYGLSRFYIAALQSFVAVTVVENPGGNVQGCLLFGLAGFAMVAAIECVRKNKPAPAKKAAPITTTVATEPHLSETPAGVH
jgi:predicted cobalt transporter CbtA